MFVPFIIAFCGVELFASHFIFWGDSFDINLLSGFITACAWVASTASQRDKSVSVVIIIWWAWSLATDRIIEAQTAVSMEASVMVVCVFWALVRPYFYPSDERRERNVCIAFYKGSHAPFLSSIASLFGLPFSSVAIVTGVTALRASGCGKMVISDARLITGDDFVFIDTGIACTPKVIRAIAECTGKPTKSFGVFRTKCVVNLVPVLKIIGYEPDNFFYKIPSIFYFQCVRKAHG